MGGPAAECRDFERFLRVYAKQVGLKAGSNELYEVGVMQGVDIFAGKIIGTEKLVPLCT